MEESLKEKLKKIKALADSGVEGEKENARAFLDLLMMRHNITEDMLAEEPIFRFAFRVKDKLEKGLLIQLVAIKTKVNTVKFFTSHSGKILKFDLTEGQFSEISRLFDCYQKEFRKSLLQMRKSFLIAFLSRNNLFSESEGQEFNDRRKRKTLTEEEIEEIRNLMASLKKVKLPYVRIT